MLISCAGDVEIDQPFITADPDQLEKYADEALEQAAYKLDSLEKTEILTPPAQP